MVGTKEADWAKKAKITAWVVDCNTGVKRGADGVSLLRTHLPLLYQQLERTGDAEATKVSWVRWNEGECLCPRFVEE